MCGILGFLGGDRDPEQAKQLLEQMANSIAHRGPDSHGTWFDPSSQMGLGHRRLSIVDLSEAGHQPMHSASGRFVIAFNGEIYNYLSLRKDLSGPWKGHSDTEVLLAGIETWGLEATLQRCTGMFAFALWDKQTQTLTLGRDRIGEKPLYYGWVGSGQNRSFVFASELKAIRRHPHFANPINREALSWFMQYGYVPAPYAIYADMFKLLPGNLLTLSKSQTAETIVPYWSLQETVNAAQKKPFQGSPQDAVSELEAKLSTTIANQLIADVPAGAFLSGGVDSSLIVALAQKQSTSPIKTFSIGFSEAAFNEAPFAKSVAKHLGTDHTELIVSPEQAYSVIPRLSSIYDEPFADSSQIPTFLVAELAKKHVTISLSGDGGDEIFCGYNRYTFTKNFWKSISRIPMPIRSLSKSMILGIPPQVFDTTLKLLTPFLPGSLQMSSPGHKLHKGAQILNSRSIEGVYQQLIRQWSANETTVLGLDASTPPPDRIHDLVECFPDLDPISKLMCVDTLTYLPDDIMVKVDRAAMAVSLESRAPFLDHTIIEFAQSLPLSMKYKDGQSKWLLREILYQHVPKHLIERPKMGFSIPLGNWLRGPLKEWANSILDPAILKRQGYLNTDLIQQKWQDHLSGKHNWAYCLWTVLMFQLWLTENENVRV
ncbi:MAG: asparagine synthase (glutamine-hydrolyzing) [Candidatus Margulisiibacteriota bacterium]